MEVLATQDLMSDKYITFPLQEKKGMSMMKRQDPLEQILMKRSKMFREHEALWRENQKKFKEYSEHPGTYKTVIVLSTNISPLVTLNLASCF